MKMKDVAYLLLSLLVLLFTACASTDNEQTVDPTPHAETLVYANLAPTSLNRTAIDRFNRKHEDVQIEIRDYSGADGRKLLFVEIAAGQMPDIIDSVDCLPYQKLAKDGYLEDLWPYIENDDELGLENVIEAPLRAAEVDGGLYMAFDSVVIYTLVGAKRIVGDRTSWTLRDLQEAFSSMPEGSTITEFYWNKYDMLSYVLTGTLDSYIDWENGQCSFDCENFRTALKFLDSYPLERPVVIDTDSSIELSEEVNWRTMTGRQMLKSVDITELGMMNLYEYHFGEPVSFVGYPTEDGSIGSYFTIYGSPIAMSSTCKNKTAAWDFIRQEFLESPVVLHERPLAIPINQKAFEETIKIAMSSPPYVAPLYGPPVELRPLTDKDIQEYKNFIDSIDKIRVVDISVYDIVEEACGPYFAGDKTLDETIDLIQHRVSLYVGEMQ